MTIFQKPTLVVPAGNMAKLKVAVLYGADAVYLGGQRYGLRAAADNFTDFEIQKAVSFAHSHGTKIYITLNAYLHDGDMEGLTEFVRYLEKVGVDAVIVSDLGVIELVRDKTNLSIHLSTQSSCLNVYAAKIWKKLGVKRIVVGRELSIEEASRIQQEAEIEVEMFAHGAMCMSYSGSCSISNYTAGRDSNRGGCCHSCRFDYSIVPEGDLPERTSHFMSSKDLMGVGEIPQFFDARIHALKIEGRMKSVLYLATACREYRAAIDRVAQNSFTESEIAISRTELSSMPNRSHSSGSLVQIAGKESIYASGKPTKENASKALAGMVIDVAEENAVVRFFAPVRTGDSLEVLPFSGEPYVVSIDSLKGITSGTLEMTNTDSIALIPRSHFERSLSPFQILRKE